MPFNKEEIIEIKKQLIEQIKKLPNENKEELEEYIKNLNEEQLEEFLKKNNINYSKSAKQSDESECIFCSLANGKIPSYRLSENKKAIAILDINPLSKAQ